MISGKFQLDELEVRCRSRQMYLCSYSAETFKHFHDHNSAASSKANKPLKQRNRNYAAESQLIKADILFALFLKL